MSEWLESFDFLLSQHRSLPFLAKKCTLIEFSPAVLWTSSRECTHWTTPWRHRRTRNLMRRLRIRWGINCIGCSTTHLQYDKRISSRRWSERQRQTASQERLQETIARIRLTSTDTHGVSHKKRKRAKRVYGTQNHNRKWLFDWESPSQLSLMNCSFSLLRPRLCVSFPLLCVISLFVVTVPFPAVNSTSMSLSTVTFSAGIKTTRRRPACEVSVRPSLHFPWWPLPHCSLSSFWSKVAKFARR